MIPTVSLFASGMSAATKETPFLQAGQEMYVARQTVKLRNQSRRAGQSGVVERFGQFRPFVALA
jgi:hypothetical protein